MNMLVNMSGYICYVQYAQSRYRKVHQKSQKYYFNAAARSCAIGTSLELYQLDIVFELNGSLGIVLARNEVHNKRVLDSKHRVVVKVLTLAVEDLRCQRAVVIIGSLGKILASISTRYREYQVKTYNNVNVSRAERMTIHQLKKLASRTIVRNGIRRRTQAVKRVLSILIRLELAAQVKLNLLGVLLLVQPVRGSLPHLDRRTDKRLFCLEVHDTTVHERHLSISRFRLDDVLAVLAIRGIRPEERAQDGRGCGRILRFSGESKGDFVHEAVVKRSHVSGWLFTPPPARIRLTIPIPIHRTPAVPRSACRRSSVPPN